MYNIAIEHKQASGKESAKALITIDLSHPGKTSSSGKSLVLASTEGNTLIPGTDIWIGINVYRKK
jgi:hypothetical protein